MHRDFEVKLPNFTVLWRAPDRRRRTFFLYFLNLAMALRSSTTAEFACVWQSMIKLKCGTSQHFLNELFRCRRELRHANKIFRYLSPLVVKWMNRNENSQGILQKCALAAGTPNDGFLLKTLKAHFWLSRVILYLYKCILSGTIKFLSVGSSSGTWVFSKITRASKILEAVQFITKVIIFLILLSITYFNPKILRFLFFGEK